MVKKSNLEKQLNSLISEAGSALDSFLEKKDSEDIHRLRVAIKKIRALAWLQKKCGASGAQAQADRLKKIFKHAGRIRTSQVMLSLIGDIGKAGRKIIASEKRKELASTRAFKKQKPRYHDLLFSVGKTTHVHPMKKKRVLRVYKKALRKTDSLLHSEEDEQIHESRKRIKRLIYNYPLLGKKAKKKLGLDKKFLGKAEETIGEWHDAVIAFDFMKKVPAISKTSLSKLEHKAGKKKKKLRSVTRSFLDKALK
jgi:CHAD domain-containing protein